LYPLIELYVDYLRLDRETRWGQAKPTELTELQTQILNLLTLRHVRTALRGRALLFYTLFDPLRQLTGSTAARNLMAMADHFRTVRSWLQSVVDTSGANILDRTVADRVWAEEPSIKEWRDKKLQRAVFRHAVEHLFERDEDTDKEMPEYCCNSAGDMLAKIESMTSDLAPFDDENVDPDFLNRTDGALVNNDIIERYNAIFKDEYHRCPMMSLTANHAATTARANGMFNRGGSFTRLPRELKTALVDLSHKEKAATAARAKAIEEERARRLSERREKDRAHYIQLEQKRAAKVAAAEQQPRIQSVAALEKELKQLELKHDKGHKTVTVRFLQGQRRLREQLDEGRKIPSFERTLPSGNKLSLPQMTEEAREMILEDEGFELAHDVLDRVQPKAILDSVYDQAPRTTYGNEVLAVFARRGETVLQQARERGIKRKKSQAKKRTKKRLKKS
jgi:hypothetical protein